MFYFDVFFAVLLVILTVHAVFQKAPTVTIGKWWWVAIFAATTFNAIMDVVHKL